jgi:hypothetical protein
MRRSWLRRALEWLCVTEVIGQDECPLMERWEFLKIGLPGREPWFKAMIHRFPPNVTDRDPHDHPRPFVTLILAGGYLNSEWTKLVPPLDLGDRMQEWMTTFEWLSRGDLRFRRARHMHITETSEQGAWTLVVMGPMARKWGFLHDGKWLPWKKYVERYGGVVRCDTGELDESQDGEYPPYTVAKHDRDHNFREYKGTPPPFDLLG